MITSWGMQERLHTPRVNRAKPSPYTQDQPTIFLAIVYLTWAGPKPLQYS